MSNTTKLAIGAAAFILIAILIIAANPICIDRDIVTAEAINKNCTAWTTIQCRQAAAELSCRRWAYWGGK